MGYWIVSLLLVVFGFITGFSIGAPFLLIGLAMLVLGPVRHRTLVFWPPFVGVLVGIVGIVLLVPLTCTASGGVGGVSSTVCTSILGPAWSGSGLYNPPPEAFAVAFRGGAGCWSRGHGRDPRVADLPPANGPHRGLNRMGRRPPSTTSFGAAAPTGLAKPRSQVARPRQGATRRG